MREFLAIEVSASIDPTHPPEEGSHLPGSHVAFLSQVNSAGPICDHGRVGGWTGKVDQSLNEVERGIISYAQPFPQPTFDDIGETMPSEVSRRPLDRFDQLLLAIGAVQHLPVEFLLARVDSFDRALDDCVCFRPDL
jgi:hypothetical protein